MSTRYLAISKAVIEKLNAAAGEEAYHLGSPDVPIILHRSLNLLMIPSRDWRTGDGDPRYILTVSCHGFPTRKVDLGADVEFDAAELHKIVTGDDW